MEQAELEQIIEKARVDKYEDLEISCTSLTFLPDSIGALTNLQYLCLQKK
jgi:Leucine-rich repeat (LRR) protein